MGYANRSCPRIKLLKYIMISFYTGTGSRWNVFLIYLRLIANPRGFFGGTPLTNIALRLPKTGVKL
eukprot:7038161-Karenia_brevis.AAC.1